MRKYFTLFCILTMFLLTTACSGLVSIMPGSLDEEEVAGESSSSQTEQGEETFTEKSFYAFMGWDNFGSNYYENTPVVLSYQEENGSVSPVYDRFSIIAACDALKNMTVTGRAEENAGQDSTSCTYSFIMSDGTIYSVTFNDSVLTTYTGSYTYAGGEDLFDLTFPIYDSDYDLFDLYFDDSIRAFADNFEVNFPVSVGRRANGGAVITATDEETIRAVFNILAGASVASIESSPDLNIDLTTYTDYIFTMGDGTSYTFTFTDACLAVTVSSVYGPVYYWLDGTETLANVSILPRTTTVEFEGGAITGLREDFQNAADAANGESDLTVEGVYVSYSFDGSNGYLTLSGDTAVSFVRTVTAITAGSEAVEEVSGDTITVSVTLSDGSGPIFYFVGDYIQQLMGSYYACDSSAISALRTTILSLAADNSNTGEVVESGTD